MTHLGMENSPARVSRWKKLRGNGNSHSERQHSSIVSFGPTSVNIPTSVFLSGLQETFLLARPHCDPSRAKSLAPASTGRNAPDHSGPHSHGVGCNAMLSGCKQRRTVPDGPFTSGTV
jgi:hypothetical protein